MTTQTNALGGLRQLDGKLGLKIRVLQVLEEAAVRPEQLQVLGAPVLVGVVFVVGHEAEAVGAAVVMEAEGVGDFVAEHEGVALDVVGVVLDHDVGAPGTGGAALPADIASSQPHHQIRFARRVSGSQ